MCIRRLERSTTQTGGATAKHFSTPLFSLRVPASPRLGVVFLLACLLTLPATAQENITLRPPVKLAKGQTVFTVQQSRAATTVVDAKTKAAVKDLSQSRVLDLRQDVLETDAAGATTKLRLTVTARLDLKATLPVEEAFEQRVEVKNVLVDLSLADGAWRIDTESIRSRDMKSLTGAELYLLRRAVRDALQIHARPDLLLLPETAAAGTKKIRPTLDQLAQWSAAANDSGRLVGQATDAEFDLVPRAGALDLTGRVWLLVPVEKDQVKATMTLSLQIDAATGLVRRRGVEFAVSAPAGSGLTHSTGSGAEVTTVSAARDGTSAPAGPFHPLGWKTEKDTSTWRDAALGVGLSLPKDALQRPGLPAWDLPGGGSVSVEVRPRDFLPDLKDVLDSGLENLRRPELNLKDIQPGEPFRLPDGLPAAIVRARSQDGKTAILVLLTADGPRTLALSAAGPAANNALLTQLEQTLRSLRVPIDAETRRRGEVTR